jgi:hypothetical protein
MLLREFLSVYRSTAGSYFTLGLLDSGGDNGCVFRVQLLSGFLHFKNSGLEFIVGLTEVPDVIERLFRQIVDGLKKSRKGSFTQSN